jgi:hypothetical protein
MCTITSSCVIFHCSTLVFAFFLLVFSLSTIRYVPLPFQSRIRLSFFVPSSMLKLSCSNFYLLIPYASFCLPILFTTFHDAIFSCPVFSRLLNLELSPFAFQRPSSFCAIRDIKSASLRHPSNSSCCPPFSAFFLSFEERKLSFSLFPMRYFHLHYSFHYSNIFDISDPELSRSLNIVLYRVNS